MFSFKFIIFFNYYWKIYNISPIFIMMVYNRGPKHFGFMLHYLLLRPLHLHSDYPLTKPSRFLNSSEFSKSLAYPVSRSPCLGISTLGISTLGILHPSLKPRFASGTLKDIVSFPSPAFWVIVYLLLFPSASYDSNLCVIQRLAPKTSRILFLFIHEQ